MNSSRADWVLDVRLKLCDERPPITPRAHQIEAWDRLLKHFFDQDNQAGLVVLPIGGGKTVIASHFQLEHHVRNGGRVFYDHIDNSDRMKPKQGHGMLLPNTPATNLPASLRNRKRP